MRASRSLNPKASHFCPESRTEGSTLPLPPGMAGSVISTQTRLELTSHANLRQAGYTWGFRLSSTTKLAAFFTVHDSGLKSRMCRSRTRTLHTRIFPIKLVSPYKLWPRQQNMNSDLAIHCFCIFAFSNKNQIFFILFFCIDVLCLCLLSLPFNPHRNCNPHTAKATPQAGDTPDAVSAACPCTVCPQAQQHLACPLAGCPATADPACNAQVAPEFPRHAGSGLFSVRTSTCNRRCDPAPHFRLECKHKVLFIPICPISLVRQTSVSSNWFVGVRIGETEHH